MLVIPFGIVMLFREVLPLNAESPILVTGKPLYSAGITTFGSVHVPLMTE